MEFTNRFLSIHIEFSALKLCILNVNPIFGKPLETPRQPNFKGLISIQDSKDDFSKGDSSNLKKYYTLGEYFSQINPR